MNGGKPAKESDEKRFNETLKRMLKTPPKPHESTKQPEIDSRSDKKQDKVKRSK
ncbi:hypothetical protein [Mesorhizobium sp. M0678]|uniref:hypothetical protein n=1 Tax=Mesorhizobium sp. M0678 TaxID=2956985 RepID=UPI0033390BC9